MATSRVRKAIARCRREQETIDQSHLRLLRQKTRVTQTLRKRRTRTFIKLGAEVVGIDLAVTGMAAVQGVVDQARGELAELARLQAALRGDMSQTPEARRSQESNKGPAGKDKQPSPLPATAKKKITIGFSKAPPEGLRAELKRMGFWYLPAEHVWKGQATREAVDHVVAAQNATHLVRLFDTSD